jgi:hypothetical protein
LARLMMADSADAAQAQAVRTAAGMAYLISLVSLAVFVVMLRAGSWPRAGVPFNVWVNLPTFEPSAGGDVVERLNRDARINIALGLLLPFLTPAVVSLSSSGFEPLQLATPQTLIWIMTAWAFLPASLFMRGIAMGRVAGMIRDKRREGAGADGRLAVSLQLGETAAVAAQPPRAHDARAADGRAQAAAIHASCQPAGFHDD